MLLILAVQFPSILSSGLGRSIIVGKINNSLSGSLSIENCDLGWSQGLSCNRVVYEDSQQGIRVDIAGVTCSQGLIALLIAPMNLGTVIVDKPLLALRTVPPVAVKEQQKSAPPEKTRAAPSGIIVTTKEKKIAKTDKTPVWDKMAVKLQVNGATVQHVRDKGQTVLIREGSLNAILASSVVDFKLNLLEGDGSGRVIASGLVNLPSRPGDLMDALNTDFKLDLIDLQLEPFLALAAAQSNLPNGSARLSSEVIVKTMGVDTLAVRGSGRAQDIRLDGGFLAGDQPQFEQISVVFDVKRDTSGNWQFSSLQLSSDFAAMAVNGNYGRQDFQVTAKGTVELPKLFEQLPGLFMAQEGMYLEQGSINVDVNVEKKEKQLQVIAKTVMNNLSGRQGGEPFSWDSPVNLNFEYNINNKETEIKNLTLRSPFLNVVGKGNPDNFSLNGFADLKKGVEELGKIVNIDWDADGRMQFSAKSTATENNRYVIDVDVKIIDFSLAQKGKNVVPTHQLSLKGHLDTPKGFPQTKSEGMNLVFDLASWPLRINGTVDNIHSRNGQVSAGYQLQSEIQLGRITELLHNFGLLDQETTIAGIMDLYASGYLEDNRLALRELDNRIENFIVYREKKIFRDPAVRLFIARPESGAGTGSAARVCPLERVSGQAAYYAEGGGHNYIDLHNRRIELRGLTFASNAGMVNAKRLSIKDWQQLSAIRSIQVDGNVNLGRMTTVLQQSGLLTLDKELGGNLVFTVDLTDNQANGKKIPGRGNAGTVNVEVSDVRVIQAGKILFVDELIVLNSRLQGKSATGDVDFESLTFHSLPLSLEATGKLQSSGADPHLALTGKMTPDFTSLVGLLNSLNITDIRMNGREEEEFKLYYPLKVSGEEKFHKLLFSTDLHADVIAKSGIVVTGPAMPVTMKEGVFRAALTGGVNNGSLQITPQVDYMADPPMVTLPKGEQLLTDVLIEKALADTVLKRVHPLFGVLARPTGSISCRMDSFGWPLQAEALKQGYFSVVFDVSEINLTPRDALQGILEMAGLGEEKLRLEQTEVTCNGEKERVSCTPLKLMAAESEMILSGSVGFDGSLDYLLEIPVTRSLVGKEGYKVLQGTTLKIPIKGDSEKSVFDADALTQAVSDLLGQAATEAAGNIIEEQAKKFLPGLLDGLMK